jgi:hypothetical protein
MRWLLAVLLSPVGFVLGYGGCGRCHATYWFARYHVTRFTSTSGCFPLCEHCWRKLGTPERRIPYYRELVVKQGVPDGEERWPLIQQAVEAGL